MPSTPPCSLLGLPRELRDLIYTALFRSLPVFARNGPQHRGGGVDGARDTRLALLYVCRQMYEEASPLVLRHVRIFCSSPSEMMRVLMALSPAQLRQLKYLRVEYDLLCLDRPAGPSYPDPAPYGFHVGTLLGLFPGLALDRLDLTDGMADRPGRFSAYHATDLMTSLLRADGYREVRAELWSLDDCFPGTFADRGQVSFRRRAPVQLDAWAELIRTRFRPRPGASVEMYFDETADADDGYWQRHRDAGFTLHEGLVARDRASLVAQNEAQRDAVDDYGDVVQRDAIDDYGDYGDYADCGHYGDCGDYGDYGDEAQQHAVDYGDELPYWNFRACRGAGPFEVREAGEGEEEEVLETVQSSYMDPAEVRWASRYLRRLCKEGDWANINRMQESFLSCDSDDGFHIHC